MLILTQRSKLGVKPPVSRSDVRETKAKMLDALRHGPVRVRSMTGLRAALELYEEGLVEVSDEQERLADVSC